MIQRIQSIYLLLAVVFSFVTPFVFPDWKTSAAEIPLAYDSSYIFGGFHFTAVVTAVSIFLFKNRKRQLNIVKFAVFLNIVLLGFLVYWFLNLPGEVVISEKGIGLLVPIVSIVFLSLAHRAIKKDDKLVKSVDRLR